MKFITEILIHFGWYQISRADLRKWKASRQMALLRLALIKGKYKVRKEAALLLGLLKDKESITLLGKAAKDEVRTVAETAINALQQFLPSKEVEVILLSTTAHWKEQDRISEGWKNYHKARKRYFEMEDRIWDKSKMKKLASAKEFLKTNNWGKGGKLSI